MKAPSQDQSLGNKSYFFPSLTIPNSWQRVVLLPIPHRLKVLATNGTSALSTHKTKVLKSYFFPFTQPRPKSWQQSVLLPIPHKTKVLATNRTCSQSSQSQDQSLGSKSYFVSLLTRPKSWQPSYLFPFLNSSQDERLGNKPCLFPFPNRPKSLQHIVLLPILRKPFRRPKYWQIIPSHSVLPIHHKIKVLATNRTSSHSSQDQSLGNKSYFLPFLTDKRLGSRSYFFPFLTGPKSVEQNVFVRSSITLDRRPQSWQQIGLLPRLWSLVLVL